jgi:hypothetical protein
MAWTPCKKQRRSKTEPVVLVGKGEYYHARFGLVGSAMWMHDDLKRQNSSAPHMKVSIRLVRRDERFQGIHDTKDKWCSEKD